MSHGIVDIVQGVPDHSFALLRRQLANLLCGTACPESPRRHVSSLKHDGSRCNERSGPNDGPAEDKAANADQGVVFDGAGVDDRLVADGDSFPHDAWIALVNVQDRTVLYV